MKVVPWMYAGGQGTGFHLTLHGHRQYNVIWKYGADHVTVQWFDKTENHDGWQDLKTVSIPGDYKGKPRREIAHGMEEHMQVICRALVREWEGEGSMSEFREEWEMHKWEKGQKVSFSTVRGGVVLGVVKGTERRMGERDVLIRVTSRKNPLWSAGDVMRVNPSSPWLKSREV
ncbi:hypothetical protein AB0E08_03700 [Streptomyces sp. NPDC048281]|uniref:hypothetical protein n=1 Tax=Streptomyces sp. NPDC048281 TaxID=3154715 RepID=UPI00341B590B